MRNGNGMGQYYRYIAQTQGTIITILVISIIITVVLSIFLFIKLRQNKRKSIELEKMRHDFVSNVSHELRTPITVIKGSLEALSEGVVTDELKVKEYYSQMLKETTWLQRLVSYLLDLSRLQNVDFPIEKADVSVCDVITDSVRSAKPLADKKGIVITTNTDNQKFVINADYGRIKQMLLIVIDNAIKFSPEGGKVDIDFKDNRLTITDYGNGIPQAELEYIFDRFHKAKDESNKQGTGLGLAIAKQIAERHNIGLTAQSESGMTKFIFTISRD